MSNPQLFTVFGASKVSNINDEDGAEIAEINLTSGQLILPEQDVDPSAPVIDKNILYSKDKVSIKNECFVVIFKSSFALVVLYNTWST